MELLTRQIAGLAHSHLAEPVDRCDAALRLIRACHGGVRIRDVAASLGVTERTVHRDVLAATGLAPKELCQILRLQYFLQLARSAPSNGLAADALTAGYSDQAHLSRECRRLAGATPSGLLR
jgi:AraC-like DNA-binding protein